MSISWINWFSNHFPIPEKTTGTLLDSSYMDLLYLNNGLQNHPLHSVLTTLIAVAQNMAISFLSVQIIPKNIYAIFLFKTLMWFTAVLRMESKHLGMGFRPCSELPELVCFPYHLPLCASVVLSCMDVQASTLTSYLGGSCFLCTETPLPFSVDMLLLILQVLAHESSFPGCCPWLCLLHTSFPIPTNTYPSIDWFRCFCAPLTACVYSCLYNCLGVPLAWHLSKIIWSCIFFMKFHVFRRLKPSLISSIVPKV